MKFKKWISTRNIKTTVAGFVAGVPQLVEGIATKNVSLALTGLGTIILGISAKDYDHTKKEE